MTSLTMHSTVVTNAISFHGALISKLDKYSNAVVTYVLDY